MQPEPSSPLIPLLPEEETDRQTILQAASCLTSLVPNKTDMWWHWQTRIQ